MKANKKLIEELDGDCCIWWHDRDWWVELDEDEDVSSIRLGQYAFERNLDNPVLEPGYLGWGGDTEFMWADDYNYNPEGDRETQETWIEVWKDFPVAEVRQFLKEFGEDTEDDEETLFYLENDYLPRLEDELASIEEEEEDEESDEEEDEDEEEDFEGGE